MINCGNVIGLELEYNIGRYWVLIRWSDVWNSKTGIRNDQGND